MRLPIRARIGSARRYASSEPPAMKVSVALRAPAVPPETGASSDGQPRSSAMACDLRALATSMVELSMRSVPGWTTSRSSAQTDRTCSPAGSIVMTASAPARVSVAEAATTTPCSAAARQEAADRSKPATRQPAFTRLAAIGPPMLPSPMKAIACDVMRVLSALRPRRASVVFPLVGNHLPVIGQASRSDDLGPPIQLRYGPQRRRERLGERRVAAFAFGEQRHRIGFTVAGHHEPEAPQLGMAPADLRYLLRPHEHPLDLGGLIGPPHPALDAHVGAPTGACPRQDEIGRAHV